MGNQLFQYAFAKSIAKRLNTSFLPFVNSPYYPFKIESFELDWLIILFMVINILANNLDDCAGN